MLACAFEPKLPIGLVGIIDEEAHFCAANRIDDGLNVTAGAHHVIDSLAELPPLLLKLDVG